MLGYGRLRPFLSRALRLGWARLPSAAARRGQIAERCDQDGPDCRALRLGWARLPSAAARMGQIPERCDQDGPDCRALRLGWTRLPIVQ